MTTITRIREWRERESEATTQKREIFLSFRNGLLFNQGVNLYFKRFHVPSMKNTKRWKNARVPRLCTLGWPMCESYVPLCRFFLPFFVYITIVSFSHLFVFNDRKCVFRTLLRSWWERNLPSTQFSTQIKISFLQ